MCMWVMGLDGRISDKNAGFCNEMLPKINENLVQKQGPVVQN